MEQKNLNIKTFSFSNKSFMKKKFRTDQLGFGMRKLSLSFTADCTGVNARPFKSSKTTPKQILSLGNSQPHTGRALLVFLPTLRQQ